MQKIRLLKIPCAVVRQKFDCMFFSLYFASEVEAVIGQDEVD